MITSSAFSERNFSTMGFIHSKLRNRLSPDSVNMLTYVKYNDGDYQPDDWTIDEVQTAQSEIIELSGDDSELDEAQKSVDEEDN